MRRNSARMGLFGVTILLCALSASIGNPAAYAQSQPEAKDMALSLIHI